MDSTGFLIIIGVVELLIGVLLANEISIDKKLLKKIKHEKEKETCENCSYCFQIKEHHVYCDHKRTGDIGFLIPDYCKLFMEKGSKS